MNYDLDFQLQVLFCYTPGLFAGPSAPTSTPGKPHGALTRPQRMGGCSHGFGLLTALDVGSPLPYPASRIIFSGSSLSLSALHHTTQYFHYFQGLFFAHSSCILELVSLIFFIPRQCQLKDNPRVHTTTQNRSLQLERPLSN